MKPRSKKNIRRTIHNALLATTMTSREMASITGIEHAVLMRALWEMVDDEKVDAVYSFRRGEKGQVLYRLPDAYYELIGGRIFNDEPR